MKWSSWMFWVPLVILTLQIDALSQNRSALRTMSTSRAEISKLDWIFLNARVSVLAGLGPQYPAPDFVYDQTTDRVVATAFVSSSWLNTTPSQKIKDTAELYCAAVFIQEGNIETKNWSRQEMFRHFYVRFLIVGKNSPVAVFENGELVLK